MNIININGNVSFKGIIDEIRKIPKWLGYILAVAIVGGLVYFTCFKSSTKELHELKLLKKELQTLKILDEIVNDNTEYVTTFINFNVKCLKKLAPTENFDEDYISTVYAIQEHYIKDIDKKRKLMNEYINYIDTALVRRLEK